MLKMRFRVALLWSVVLLPVVAQADSVLRSADSFQVLQAAVEALPADEVKHTLIVMDDDDTLTMMPCANEADPHHCQYLGGPAWYAWQSELIHRGDPTAVARDTDGLLDIAALLLAINNMDYTEADLPAILDRLGTAGAKLLVLTARGPANVAATEAQFEHRATAADGGGSFLSLIRNHALQGKTSGMASLAGPFLPAACGIDPGLLSTPRPVSYQQGVMYVAGQNKGAMLQCLLDRTESADITHVFFIDDTLQNVRDVAAAFAARSGINVTAYHYTRLEAHKAALTLGPNAKRLQWNAERRWKMIRYLLERELQAPALPGSP